jgi:hypothetical protein
MSIEHDGESRLADAHAALLRDRDTFERQTSRVLGQLTAEKLELAELSRRLLADRDHLLRLGRRLRRRWLGQRKTMEGILRQREEALIVCLEQVELESIDNQIERTKLREIRERLVKDKAALNERARSLAVESKFLKMERAELVAYRSRFEAERRSWEEQRQRRQEELHDLERRIVALMAESEKIKSQQPFSEQLRVAGSLQKVA